MLKYIPTPCVIVDVETTGGNVTSDRITEIGIVEIDDNGINEWSTLINPGTYIPEHIQHLTGITNEMVSSAPYFEQVAKEIVLRLQNKLFIAHNVRFDYGFIRNEFSRLAYPFKAKLMCTVKLSRQLYPEHKGHSLEKIINRHSIPVSNRHRALDDAKATFEFIKIAEADKEENVVKAALDNQFRRASLPANINTALIDELPPSPGVYFFWGENQALLYVGKSNNIRKRVLSHFTADHKSSKEMKICQQTRNITFEKTTGDLSALILESQKVKELKPLYNRQLRRISAFYSVCLNEEENGLLTPQVISVTEIPKGNKKLYGLFPSLKKAKDALQSICNENNLCYQACQLEKIYNRACSSYQMKKCKGYCVGKQSAVLHNIKLLEGLSKLALKTWPYKGPVALIEQEVAKDALEQYLIIDNWCVMGMITSMSDNSEELKNSLTPQIDKDIYRYLVKAIFTKKSSVKIIPLYNQVE